MPTIIPSGAPQKSTRLMMPSTMMSTPRCGSASSRPPRPRSSQGDRRRSFFVVLFVAGGGPAEGAAPHAAFDQFVAMRARHQLSGFFLASLMRSPTTGGCGNSCVTSALPGWASISSLGCTGGSSADICEESTALTAKLSS